MEKEMNEKKTIDDFINNNLGYILIICIAIIMFIGYVTGKKGDRDNILKKQSAQQGLINN